MNLKFVLNEYILMWNLLFRKSLSKPLNEKKQKIWLNYKRHYSELQTERINILEDPQNYIPNDDTIYNIMREDSEYKESVKYTSKYKFTINRVFDIEKNKILEECRNITRLEIDDYLVLIVDPRLKIVEYEEFLSKVICYGKALPDLDSLFDIIYNIYKKEILEYFKDDINNKCIIDIVLEFLLCEIRRRVTDSGSYVLDDSKLKTKIYLGFLMYLGVRMEEIDKYLPNDGINIDKEILVGLDDNRYLYKKNLYVFIKYCDEHFFKDENNNYEEEDAINIRIEEII